MTTMILISTLSLALGAAPQPAVADPPAYVRTRVEVDIEPLVTGSPGEDPETERGLAEGVRDEVLEGLGEALGERNVPLDPSSADAVIKVGLRWQVYLDSHYEIRVEVQRAGSTQLVTDSLECVLCDGTKLAAVLVDEVPSLLRHLEVTSPEEESETEAGPPVSVATSGAPADEPAPRAKPLGPVGYAGIAASIVGGVGIAVGAVSLARGEQETLEGNPRFQRIDDYRPRGAALVGVGGAVFVAGVVMIVVDQTVLKRRRVRSARRPLVSPTVHANGAALTVSAHF